MNRGQWNILIRKAVQTNLLTQRKRASVCLRGCMHLFIWAKGYIRWSMFVSLHLRVPYTNIQIRKCSTGNSELKTGQNKSGFLIFPGQYVYVCIHYISRWKRTNTTNKELTHSARETNKPSFFSIQEGSGWKTCTEYLKTHKPTCGAHFFEVYLKRLVLFAAATQVILWESNPISSPPPPPIIMKTNI